MGTKKNEMKAFVMVEYNGNIYTSDEQIINDEGYFEEDKGIKEFISGRESCMYFDDGYTRYYFPREVIQKSVISIHRYES